MKVHLVVEQGRRRRIFQLAAADSLIGRSHGNTVRIPSAQVSRKHCRLQCRDGLVYVEDLGSVNGTFLNGQKVRAREVVRPGDALEVGPVSFIVEYDLTPGALKRLRAMGEPEPLDAIEDVGMLEALADGEIVDADEISDLEGVADDLELDLSPDPGVEPAEEGIKPDFDFDAVAWQPPAGDDLRGLLEQMEDDSPSPPPKKKPKR